MQEISAPLPSLPDQAQIGASIGLCIFPYDGMTVSDLIHRADEAMYRVKTSGKGNFSAADTSVPEPMVSWAGSRQAERA